MGSESEKPADVRFIDVKRFSFTRSEKNIMTNATEEWANKATFQQISRWSQLALLLADKAKPPKAEDGMVARVSGKSPSVQQDFATMMTPCMSALVNSKDKPKDLYLIPVYSSNPTPPSGGKPLLIRQREAVDKSAGAKIDCQKHGPTSTMTINKCHCAT